MARNDGYAQIADTYLPYLIHQESRGRAGVLGPQTRYGVAEGMTQMLPETAREMAGRLGVAWRPELMRGTSQEAAAYQTTLGREYFIQGLEQTNGNVQQALMYYHGGPDRRLWGPKTQRYSREIMAHAQNSPPPAPIAQQISFAGFGPASDPDYDNMSDAELQAIIDQEAASQSAPTDPNSMTDADYDNMSDEQLQAIVNQETARLGDGSFVLARSGGQPVTEAQQRWYMQQQAAGTNFRDPNTQWGTREAPYAANGENRTARPGEWFVDLDGTLIQVPEDAIYDEGLGFMKGVLTPLNNAAGLLEDGVGMIIGRDNLDAFNQWTHDYLGMANGVDDAEAQQAAFFDRQAARGRLPGRLGEFGGNLAGTAPLAIAAPQGFVGSVVAGGLTGAALTDEEGMEVVPDILTGAALGGVADRTGRFIMETPAGQAVRNLVSRGVRTTPAQTLGLPNEVDRAIGTFIPGANRAVQRSLDDFAAVANREATEAFGQSVIPSSVTRSPAALGSLMQQAPSSARTQSLEELAHAGWAVLPESAPRASNNIFNRILGNRAGPLGNVASMVAPSFTGHALGPVATGLTTAGTAAYSPLGSAAIRRAWTADRDAFWNSTPALDITRQMLNRPSTYGLFGGTFGASQGETPGSHVYYNPPDDLSGLY